MSQPLNIQVNDAIHGIAGELTPNPVSGRMTLAGEDMAFVKDIDTKIAAALVDQMTEEQVESIVEQAIQTAETSGEIATETWVQNQGYLSSISVDGTTITGNGTTGNPLVASGGGNNSNVTYNRSTGKLTVDGVPVTTLDLGLGSINADSIRTTSIVEGVGGILAGSFLQNEDGEDYILQKDVESTYVKKTDLKVDNAPVEGSNNLVTSGGVYDFTTAKTIGPDFSGTLAEVTVGMNLDGVTLHLPYNVATGNDENQTHLVDFADGSWIGWASSPYGYGQIDSEGHAIMGVGNSSPPEWNTDSLTWWHETHTIPPGTGNIVAVAPNIGDFNIATLTTFDVPGREITLTVQDVSDNVNEKVDKYYDLIPGTKTFADLVVGDDLSGVTVTFPDPIDMINLTGSSTNSQLVNFTNGYYINLSINTVQTPAYFRLIDTNGQAAQNFYQNSKTPTVTSYTFPDGFVISSINTSDINQFYGGSWQTQITFDGIQIESEITIKWLYDQINQETANLKSHVLHDADLYQSILVAAREEAQAIYDGMDIPLSTTGTTIIGTGGILDIGSTGQYVAPSNGGITITFSAVLALGNVAVLVNGTEVFNSSALSLLSVPPPTTVRVNSGDRITSTGSLGLLSSLNVTFYPNKPI